MSGEDPDHATRDLHESIERGEYPCWTLERLILTPEQAKDFPWDIFDITKVWPHKEVPPIKVGKLVLNRNPANYFPEVEQACLRKNEQRPRLRAYLKTPSCRHPREGGGPGSLEKPGFPPSRE